MHCLIMSVMDRPFLQPPILCARESSRNSWSARAHQRCRPAPSHAALPLLQITHEQTARLMRKPHRRWTAPACRGLTFARMGFRFGSNASLGHAEFSHSHRMTRCCPKTNSGNAVSIGRISSVPRLDSVWFVVSCPVLRIQQGSERRELRRNSGFRPRPYGLRLPCRRSRRFPHPAMVSTAGLQPGASDRSPPSLALRLATSG